MSRIPIPATIDAAPIASRPLLEAVKKQLGIAPNLFRLVAVSPAALEGYVGMSGALSKGSLPAPTRERIALAVAEHREDSYSIAQHAKSARRAGLGLDEVSRARSFTSADPKEAALLLYLKEALDAEGPPPLHLHEEAREIGWTDEEILEAVGHLALNEFQSLIASAAALPQDQATPRVLPSAA